MPGSTEAKRDAGLPNKNGRDPHKPGESPALHGGSGIPVVQKQRRMLGFPTEPVGTPTNRGKAQRYRIEERAGEAGPTTSRAKMPGFPTKSVGTSTRRRKARRYMPRSEDAPSHQISRFFSCRAGLCPGLWGLAAFFAGRARHGFLPRWLPSS